MSICHLHVHSDGVFIKFVFRFFNEENFVPKRSFKKTFLGLDRFWILVAEFFFEVFFIFYSANSLEKILSPWVKRRADNFAYRSILRIWIKSFEYLRCIWPDKQKDIFKNKRECAAVIHLTGAWGTFIQYTPSETTFNWKTRPKTQLPKLRMVGQGQQ